MRDHVVAHIRAHSRRVAFSKPVSFDSTNFAHARWLHTHHHHLFSEYLTRPIAFYKCFSSNFNCHTRNEVWRETTQAERLRVPPEEMAAGPWQGRRPWTVAERIRLVLFLSLGSLLLLRHNGQDKLQGNEAEELTNAKKNAIQETLRIIFPFSSRGISSIQIFSILLNVFFLHVVRF